MSNDNLVSLAAPAGISDPLTDLLRSGARRLIEAAVSAEFEEYLSAFVDEKLLDGRQRVVRNGHLPVRKILTGVGEVDVRVPKARSRSGSPEPFRSSVVPPYVRRCASLDAAIPWLYLHGVSTGQMRQAVAALVGNQAARGQSAQALLGRGVPVPALAGMTETIPDASCHHPYVAPRQLRHPRGSGNPSLKFLPRRPGVPPWTLFAGMMSWLRSPHCHVQGSRHSRGSGNPRKTSASGEVPGEGES